MIIHGCSLYVEKTERLAECLRLIYTCRFMALVKNFYVFVFEEHCTK
jgi:hypothetical protein